MVHEDIEGRVGDPREFRTLVDTGEIGAEHHPEMARVRESELDVSLEQSGGGVEVTSLFGRPQGCVEHGESFDGDGLEDALAVGEVVIRSLMTHSGRCGNLAEGQSIRAVFGDEVHGRPQNCGAKIRRRHEIRINLDLDNVKEGDQGRSMTTTDSPRTNRYLLGNYAPVTEEVTAVDLPVIGELPAELNGRYLRNGPNPISEVDPETHHWFIGDGMVHGICLGDGQAKWYRNRYVGSSTVSAVRGLPDIPGRNWNNSPGGPNTNVGGFAGTTWAMVEAGGCPVELTYELETVGRNDFYGTLPGAFTAHPKIDPATGEMHAMTYAWGEWMDRVQYVRVGKDGRVNRTVDIPLPGMSMVHDVSITDRYIVVYDQPVLVDLDLAFSGRRFPFRWSEDYGNRIGLMPRDGTASDIVWIDVPMGYVFHPLNAYDTADGTVVLDVCFYERMMRDDMNGPFGDSLPRLVRWEAHPVNGHLNVTVIDERVNEFPRHRGSLTGKPYRYGYCAQVDTGSMHWPTVKHDLLTGAREVFDHGPGRAAGEPVFVGRPGSTVEDDGWLVTFVHDGNDDSADFVVLDAQDFARGYVARVKLPQRVPFGFHGNWVPDKR